jgi:hypothetical protein
MMSKKAMKRTVDRIKSTFWEGYLPEPVKPEQCKYPKCSYPCTDLPDCRDAEQPAQQALDKKAENARELGLDYEPAQQEPVAHFGSAYVNENGVHVTTVLGPVAIPQDAKLYTSPPAQRTWVGLSDEDLANCSGHEVRWALYWEKLLKERNT